ncbi:MAG TPA: putative LPS assembly protein LptD, partial [Candidatus Kapabacteria bacterium]|nr:putative LPS assembly protein LptD [Candidatus Kapabacteria bacterium]
MIPYLNFKYVVWVLCVLCIATQLRAQGTTPPTDTSKAAPKPKQVRPGFDLPDSLYISRDTTRGDIDTIVRYTAKDSTVFDIARKRMTLVNTATVQFENRDMKAYTIVMDFEQNTLTAYSYDVDSVISASLALRRRIIRDTNRVKSRGAPILQEGATTYVGEVIVYNFKTRRGTVQLGTTEMEGGFYYGEKIKQVAPQTLFVENGRYTTCDEPVPHYYFESPKMKVIMGDLVFAEPVYLYVADVPIFALPFGVFPNHSGGRHSGIIAPNYQTTGDRGYGLTHLGYYVVFNDYFDAAAQADIFTKGGWNADFKTEWMKRYLLSGPATLHLGYGYTRFNSVDPYTPNWLVEGTLPSLILGYETQLNANLSFQSNGYFQNNALNLQQLLTQQITSNASFTTGWSDLGLNLGVGYSRFQQLSDGTYTETSPSLTFSKSTFFPFASSNGEPVDPTLASLAIGYNLSASRNVAKNLSIVNGDSSFYNTEQYGVLHSPTISISPKLGHFAITPSFSYQEAWVFKQHRRNYSATLVPDSANHTVDTIVNYTETSTDGFHRIYNYNMGVGISTT